MHTIAVLNQKGGVGKTTTTINLGAALAADGYKVLLIDLDPQGDMTGALAVVLPEDQPSLAQALNNSYTGDPAALVVLYAQAPGLGIIPNTLEMFTINRELDNLRARESRLHRILSPLGSMFDFCLLDCPPALDTITDNALTAADGVIIPAQAEDSSLRAVRLLLGQVTAVEQDLRQTPLTLHGFVVTMLERGPADEATGARRAKSLVARSVIESYEAMTLPILATIPRAVVAPEADRAGQSVVAYAPGSEQAEAYRKLASVVAGMTS